MSEVREYRVFMLWSRSLQTTDGVIKLGELKEYLTKRHFIKVWQGVEKPFGAVQ